MNNDQSTTCDGCFWKDDCGYSSPCDYYYPLCDEKSDEQIRLFIENERHKFIREWDEYIREFE